MFYLSTLCVSTISLSYSNSKPIVPFLCTNKVHIFLWCVFKIRNGFYSCFLCTCLLVSTCTVDIFQCKCVATTISWHLKKLLHRLTIKIIKCNLCIDLPRPDLFACSVLVLVMCRFWCGVVRSAILPPCNKRKCHASLTIHKNVYLHPLPKSYTTKYVTLF